MILVGPVEIELRILENYAFSTLKLFVNITLQVRHLFISLRYCLQSHIYIATILDP